LRPTHAALEAEDREHEQQHAREAQPEHDARPALQAGARA
jgi:hypothetical protein